MKNIKYVCILSNSEIKPKNKTASFVLFTSHHSAQKYGKEMVAEEIKKFQNNQNLRWNESRKEYLKTSDHLRFTVISIERFFKFYVEGGVKENDFYKTYFNACIS